MKYIRPLLICIFVTISFYVVSSIVNYRISNLSDGPISLRNDIDFFELEGPKISMVISRGFSNIESWGVWANNGESKLNLPSLSSGFYTIRLYGSTLSNVQLDNSKVSILSGNKMVSSQRFSFVNGYFEYKGSLEGEVKLIVEGVNGISPKDLGINQDDRVLFYSLSKVQIFKLK